MRRKDVKTVITYYFGIKAMRKVLAVEWAELEDEYNGLRGMSFDGARPGNFSLLYTAGGGKQFPPLPHTVFSARLR